MNRIFSRTAWNDFMEWVKEDRKLACKVDALLSDIERNGHEGIGKPEGRRPIGQASARAVHFCPQSGRLCV